MNSTSSFIALFCYAEHRLSFSGSSAVNLPFSLFAEKRILSDQIQFSPTMKNCVFVNNPGVHS